MRSKQETLQQVVEGVKQLPPIPTSIIELRKMAADPNAEYSRIVPLLNQDPGLATDLLKYANSARYGVTHHVDTLDEAIIYFGMSNLVELIAAVFTDKVVRDSFKHIKGLDSYFTHSQQIAFACRALSHEAGLSIHDQEAIALMGLIHDIGKLVLTVAADRDTIPLLGIPIDKMKQLIEEEDELLGINHATVGCQICDKWNFPKSFYDGILRHHTPLKDGELSKEGYFIFLAHAVGLGIDDETIVAAAKSDLFEQVNLSPAGIIKVNDILSEEFGK